MAKKLTPEVEQAILKAAATLTTASAITEEVNAKLGKDISRRTVADFLQRTRTERADIAKNVVREKLAKTVCTDLDVLARERTRLERVADIFFNALERAAEGEEPNFELVRMHAGEHRRTVSELRQVVDTSLRYSGADTPDDANSELAAAAERVRGRLGRLAPSGGTGEGSS